MANGSRKVIVGLGRTGYSCARYFRAHAQSFSIVDHDPSPALLSRLLQEMPEIEVRTGALDLDVLLAADELVISPGVPLNLAEIAAARNAGITLTGDIDIFSRAADKPIIAITGSNGKSSVTTLVGEMAQACGVAVGVGGNLGLPALDLLEVGNEMYVLEISSFQLETTASLNAEVAVVLNLSPDHLDRYPSENDYYETKAKIYSGCRDAVWNRDEEHSVALPIGATVWSFGSDEPIDDHQFGLVTSGNRQYLAWGSNLLLPVDEMSVRGTHNFLNALAALAVAAAAGLAPAPSLLAARRFTGLEHRCEWLGSVDQVDYVNDSKATNVGAAMTALESLGRDIKGKIVLIAGGLGKGADFAPLIVPVRNYVRDLVLIGKDADAIERILMDHTNVHRAGDLSNAFRIAREQANEGDMVLLAPACSSLDMYKNFEHRGNHFKELFLQIQGGRG